MRYYVVINGESSLNIQGLAIQSLPNISKPLMRSRREEIDGRDGDVITKLGYSAYDKTLKIGLWGNYDINQVIAFFNQEGVITFSNEPDKYYNFTILNREDYINKLEAFREASITIHCQPFKYEINEQPIELDNEYVTKTDTSMTFDNSVVATIEDISLKGNTLQNGTPTPSSPIPINNVSGDNDVVVCGKNLINKNNYRLGYYDSSGNWNNANNNATFDLILVKPNTTYTFSTNANTDNKNFVEFGINKNFITRATTSYNTKFKTITTSQNTYYISVMMNINNQAITQSDIDNLLPQLEQKNEPTTYEAYNCTTYPINLPVENLFDKDNPSLLNGYVNYLTGVFTAPTTNNQKCFYVKVKPNTKYIWYDYTTSATLGYGLFTNIPSANSNSNSYGQISATKTITTGTNDNYLVMFYSATNTSVDLTQFKVGNGTEITTYSIELNKIGTYQDYIYKENNKWYLHKEIGKITLNGTENITKVSASNKNIYNINNIPTDYLKSDGNITAICNFISCIRQYQTDDNFINNAIDNSFSMTSGNGNKIRTRIDSITTADDLKTYLTNNLTYIYYVLETATNTEITYTPLIEQLNTLEQAQSKNGTTNVNQVNNDAPFILDASVLSGGNSVVVNNKGNIYSKPIMTIYGSGNIGVYLSDSQIFNINLGNEEYITLDTANMEAYKVGVLKNRLVNGDYNSFRLETGNNTISFTGNVTKVELENYSRWI